MCEVKTNILEGQIDIMEVLDMGNEQKNISQDGVLDEKKENKSFEVSGIESADWCFKKIAEYKDEHTFINTYADAEIEKINRWRDEELKHYDTTFFEVKLKEYYAEQRELNPRFRLSTPHGAISARRTTKYKWINENEIIEYLKENHSSALRIKEELDKNEFKKLYRDGVDHETGEIIPGVEVEEVESFSIKIK